ncbi:hypothetical protein PORCRE_615 [Porphyromonas crevioricanis JCM 15906]|uniref:Uncharacterized protein n=1 Tax=Porphyromonas crevioricanis JCM 15906 TaxID=1305617 RepID=T1CP59_9PORP|nr:hypothetical protein PORCRE_615 [Porphyromonas crevioricanis JCM 15906]GAD06855.1 hypothetical protein PORCAN_463 [Porphyromonas crevioricanis JCM 13913]
MHFSFCVVLPHIFRTLPLQMPMIYKKKDYRSIPKKVWTVFSLSV